MIKLERSPCPTFLTTEVVEKLTEEFKTTGASVWNTTKIKEPLLLSSKNKCAYCECPLDRESNYMEVEHFEGKKENPDKVVQWDNLLPACKKCNSSKSDHDVLAEPIVNPYVDDPRVHLAFRMFRFRARTDKGKATIDVANLNHTTRLVLCRFEIGTKIAELIETALERFATYQDNATIRNRNRLTGIVEGMLRESVPMAPYAASTATILLTDPKFRELVDAMKKTGGWTPDLDKLHAEATAICLEIC